MEKQENLKKMMFKNLLQKMYEKGETERDITTRDIVRDLEIELRSIITYK
jgi:hypothetical protein